MILQVTITGFDPETDETDDLIIWCTSDSQESLEVLLKRMKVPYQSIDDISSISSVINENDKAIDFRLN